MFLQKKHFSQATLTIITIQYSDGMPQVGDNDMLVQLGLLVKFCLPVSKSAYLCQFFSVCSSVNLSACLPVYR